LATGTKTVAMAVAVMRTVANTVTITMANTVIIKVLINLETVEEPMEKVTADRTLPNLA
jgi:hypothetical protein